MVIFPNFMIPFTCISWHFTLRRRFFFFPPLFASVSILLLFVLVLRWLQIWLWECLQDGPTSFDLFSSFLKQSLSSDTARCSRLFYKTFSRPGFESFPSSDPKPAVILRSTGSLYRDLSDRFAHYHLVSLLLGPL